ncbi:MAG: glycogen/starch/alpha-glucan phosphorylase [Ignavibacteria bacterium]|nr:glycogen/starch/alpha-glucan phosphorylase [Ignavibacteria bacterium]
MGFKDNSPYFTDYESGRKFDLLVKLAEHLEYNLGKDKNTVTKNDAFMALALSIRDKMMHDWIRTQKIYFKDDVKKVHYLSMEFLMGRLLGNSLINLDYYSKCFHLLEKIGYQLEDIREVEHDMGLGNGGLGRLAACFLDSLSTLQIPAFGYGIRYEYGIFEQAFDENGAQIEKPDDWLSYGNPWEVIRPEILYRVKFFGEVETYTDEKGTKRYKWVNTDDVLALAYDTPIPGYKNETVNTLRLWQAKSTHDFKLEDFNNGDYFSAVQSKNESEIISKVLYPNDSFQHGKILRLKQQYFFVSATIQDIIKSYKKNHSDFSQFAEKNALQLNDTHPTIAIPELMRVLLDEEGLSWEESWDITTNTFGYTNHTVVPEAMEEWSIELFGKLLPRHLLIIYEINARFLNEVRKKVKDVDSIAKLSIIREGNTKYIKMANLAIIGSHSVNGVAALHTQILKNKIFKEFYNLFPEKFNNKTNGITPRRFLKKANPFLSGLITDRIGRGWVRELDKLRKLEKFADDSDFIENWMNAKWLNKKALIDYIADSYNLEVNPDSMFDVQIKRIHEYKRQLLNALHVIHLYNRIKESPNSAIVPRTVLFGGKAAPGYVMAKLIIKLINNIAKVVNNDKEVGDKLKVLFIPNYSVSLAEKIIPASDLSEQISTAGLEASGTGNMKFALNGALTIGTLDGANVEILEEVGDDNIFIFGLKADEVEYMKETGYNPVDYYNKSENLQKILNMVQYNIFSKDEPGVFQPIIDDLLHRDNFFVLADFENYINTQLLVEQTYLDKQSWNKKSILNVARVGKFSSDRTISEYAKDIWHISPYKI